MKERLQKVMAQAGIASRRKAEEIILQGRVKVNGRVVKELGIKVSPGDKIEVDGQPIQREQKVYLLLNKPVAYLSTVDDPRGRRTVLDLIQGINARIYPVGRLDYDTSGLLILTNDGNLTYKLTHPAHEVDKRYQVEVKGHPGARDFRLLEKGVKLADGWTAPAKVENIKFKAKSTVFDLIIHEGRNRQVRRMCESLGYPVINLKRTAFAFLTLRGLKPGEFRHLTPKEVKKLQDI